MLFHLCDENFRSTGTARYVFFMSCISIFGFPSASISPRFRNLICFEPKCMVGDMRRFRLFDRRISASTPTENPAFQRSSSHTIGASVLNSISCRFMPTEMPKCIGRKSIYGLCCITYRFCAKHPVAIVMAAMMVISFSLIPY